MKYTFLLMEETESGRKLETVFETDDLTESAQVIGMLGGIENGRGGSSGKPSFPKNGKGVYVLSVNALADTQLKAGDSFPSALAASQAMGILKYNAVSMALSKAKTAGDYSVILKGVEFCYENNIPGVDHV